MSTVSRRTLVRAAAVTACAGTLLALPAASALAEGVPAASAAYSSAVAPRTLVKSLALADGVSRANVYRVAEGVYQADILTASGATAATLTSRAGIAGFGGSGRLHAALQPDGRLSSWVGDTAGHSGTPGSAGHKTGTRDGRVVRASAPDTRTVAAGATGALGVDVLAGGAADGVLLLAAGGGIAAVGAAGLGFAMLRRGRTGG
ncbi:hypothetical protein ABZZ20_05560 [Streptomyces sp. NPDC006430]|uniref:hypothetical protein n=1 Tax=Streptomyces sp. NPDC006430 TaxID=3154299 RepID=UPI0033A7EA9F